MDFDAITMGEVEEIEAYAGLPISKIAETDLAGASKLRTALVWVVKRRENADFTIQDAKNLPVSEMNAILFGEGDEEKKG